MQVHYRESSSCHHECVYTVITMTTDTHTSATPVLAPLDYKTKYATSCALEPASHPVIAWTPVVRA